MEFNQSRVVHEKVNLTDETINSVATHRLKQLLGEGEHLREKDGKFIVTKDQETFGRGFGEDYVREATDLDIAVFMVLGALRGT